MRSVLIVVIAVLVVTSPFFVNFSFCQEIDSLILPTTYIDVGDTVVLSLCLSNKSFAVGSFTSTIILPDSLIATFVDIQRGYDVSDYVYFNSTYSLGLARIVGIANLPGYDHVSPLPIGYHEIAVITITVTDNVQIGSYLDVMFNRSGEMINVISDSTGYFSLEAFTVDGLIIVDYPFGIEDAQSLPDVFSLNNNYPNPFNGCTNIEFVIQEPGYVLLEVYDVLGRRVARLFDNYTFSGYYNIKWNGVSDNTQPVSSGIYFYTLYYNEKSVTKKMSLLK